jgi:hypothetical protein
MKCPHGTKSKIAPAVRAKLEELGADVVRSKLTWIMNVRTLGQQDEPEPLGDNLSATRKEMQEWLKEKAACDQGQKKNVRSVQFCTKNAPINKGHDHAVASATAAICGDDG